MFHRGWFLISVGDPMLSQQLTRVVSAYGVASCEPLGPKSLEHLVSSRRWAGCIADASSSNLSFLSALRTRAPSLPVLMALRVCDLTSVNRLQSLNVESVVMPVPEPNLVGFVQRAFAASFLPDDRVARMVSPLAAERDLTARELQLLAFSLGNEPRERVRRRLGIQENTLKTQIRGLLRKCGERSVDSLAKNVLRAALLSEKPALSCVPPVSPWLLTARSA